MRFSPLTQVTPANVAQLKVAWHTRVAIPTKGKPNFTGAFSEAEPVVYNGTMYMPDTKGNVFAFDAVTGERLWYYKPKYPKGFASGLPTSRLAVSGCRGSTVSRGNGRRRSTVASDSRTRTS